MSEKPTEESAKKWEETAKQAVAQKEYDKAIQAYENACDIYIALGWKGQLGIIRQQIVKLESIKNMVSSQQREDIDKKKLLQQKEKEADSLVTKSKNLHFQKNYDEAIVCLEKALTLYDEVGFSFQLKKISWEINKIKEERASSLRTQAEQKAVEEEHKKGIAEEREERIRLEKERMVKLEQIRLASIEEERKLKEEIELERRKKLEELKLTKEMDMQKWAKAPEPEDDKVKKFDFEEKIRKMKELKEAQLAKERKLEEANKMLDEAKLAVSMKEFEKARSIYKQAAQMFAELGWKDQAEMIAKEVEVITRKEQELVEKKLKEEQSAQKRQQEIDEIIRKDQEEKERLRKLREEEAKKRPPEEQKKIELANFAIQKSHTEEEKGRIPQAIQRLEFALEIFTELKMDEEQIKNVKDTLERLQNQSKSQ